MRTSYDSISRSRDRTSQSLVIFLLPLLFGKNRIEVELVGSLTTLYLVDVTRMFPQYVAGPKNLLPSQNARLSSLQVSDGYVLLSKFDARSDEA